MLNLIHRLSLLCLLNEVTMCFVYTRSPVSICVASWCASFFSLTFSSRLVSFLVEFWTLLPFFILYVLDHNRLGFWMLTLETAYLIAFVDLVPAATEKVSLIQSNIVWNRWKSTLRAGSIRVNLNHGTEM